MRERKMATRHPVSGGERGRGRGRGARSSRLQISRGHLIFSRVASTFLFDVAVVVPSSIKISNHD